MSSGTDRRERRSAWIVCALAAAMVLAGACSGGEPADDGTQTLPRPATSTPSAVTPARYVTDLAFAGFSAAAPSALLRFRNDISPASLSRRYRIWVGRGERWDTALSVADSLPVPRAAWRILPGHGLRVMAANGGELAGLVLRGPDSAFQLEPGKVLDEWTSPTGQRSRLLLAAWSEGGEPATGLLFERREARPFDMPPPRTLEEALLATDAAGNGVLVLRDVGDEDTARAATTVYTWLDGHEARWPEARMDVRPSAGGPGWSIRIAEAGLDLSLTYGARVADDTVVADTTSQGAGLRLHALRGTLRLAGRARPAHGLAFLARGP
jgi:hypothetical protein